MPKLPTVAIIGKPNVGKSTLFNRIVGKRKAIVSEIPGTTRDHISHRIDTETMDYLLIDTGGMGSGTDDKEFEQDVYKQSMLALTFADVILFMVDGTKELTSDDHRIIDVLRKSKKNHAPVLLVASKIDNPRMVEEVRHQYHALGIGQEIFPISAVHRSGTVELESAIVRTLLNLHFVKADTKQKHAVQDAPVRLAVLGKPNVGKSSLINALMADPDRERSPLLVSDVAGTTRDSVDTIIYHEKIPYILVDTAGLKKSGRTQHAIEKYAMFRTIAALEMCDIAVLMLDATQLVSHQDKRIASMIVESGKGCIILLNKMDLLSTAQRKQVLKEVKMHLNFCRFATIIPVSATSKTGIVKLFEHIEGIRRNRRRHIPTASLRRWFERVVMGQPLGEVGRSKYITQADEVPPTFIVFVKNPKIVSVSQLRYLENRLRETFAFEGTPIRWITKKSDGGSIKK